MIFTLDNILEIALAVALALILARFLGYIFDKLKQPPVIGEILAGILLGGFGLGLISGLRFSIFNWAVVLPKIDYTGEDFSLFAGLGILFLMFISGLEINLSKFKGMEKASFYVAVGGVIVPLILGFAASISFGFSWQASTVIGLMLVATSVGVTVRTLMDLKILNTYPGIAILGAAVVDDVIGIVLLTFLLVGGSLADITFLAFTMILYFLIFIYIGIKILGRVLNLGEKIQLPKAFLGISIAIMLIYSYFAFKSGITGIIGAFLAGTIIGNTIYSKKIIDDVKVIGEGFLIPLFFVWVGATVDITAFLSIGIFALVIICVAIVGKIVGCSIGAKFAGMKTADSIQIGVGMIPRMEMALITVSVAITHGVLTGQVAHQVMATTITVTIATTLITPPLLKITINLENILKRFWRRKFW